MNTSNIKTSLRVFIVFAILLGIIYPLIITVVAQVFMPDKANGSLIVKNSVVIGSTFIGQNFSDDKYFHSRFSAVNYDATNSGGSNLGPSNKKLIERTQQRLEKIRAENHLAKDADIPADMVLSSGSGLDPHISVKNATLQLPRVAKARAIPEEQVHKLIGHNIDHDFIGIWGTAGVNVLKLNLALDELKGAKPNKEQRHDQ